MLRPLPVLATALEQVDALAAPDRAKVLVALAVVVAAVLTPIRTTLVRVRASCAPHPQTPPQVGSMVHAALIPPAGGIGFGTHGAPAGSPVAGLYASGMGYELLRLAAWALVMARIQLDRAPSWTEILFIAQLLAALHCPSRIFSARKVVLWSDPSLRQHQLWDGTWRAPSSPHAPLGSLAPQTRGPTMCLLLEALLVLLAFAAQERLQQLDQDLPWGPQIHTWGTMGINVLLTLLLLPLHTLFLRLATDHYPLGPNRLLRLQHRDPATRSPLALLRHVVRTEGPGALYRGWTFTFLATVVLSALAQTGSPTFRAAYLLLLV